jgi:Ni/Co efflux regulator RcnB
MSVGVMEDYKLRDLRAPHRVIHWVVWEKSVFIYNHFLLWINEAKTKA